MLSGMTYCFFNIDEDFSVNEERFVKYGKTEGSRVVIPV